MRIDVGLNPTRAISIFCFFRQKFQVLIPESITKDAKVFSDERLIFGFIRQSSPRNTYSNGCLLNAMV